MLKKVLKRGYLNKGAQTSVLTKGTRSSSETPSSACGRVPATRYRAVCDRGHGVQSCCGRIVVSRRGTLQYSQRTRMGPSVPRRSTLLPRRAGSDALGHRNAVRRTSGVPLLGWGIKGHSQRTRGLLHGILQEQWCIRRTRRVVYQSGGSPAVLGRALHHRGASVCI